jgi:hypothetical protein
VRDYLAAQLPPADAASLAIVVVASYCLYGRMGEDTPWGYPVAAATLTVVLIFIQIRLAEDVEIWCNGGEVFGKLGRWRGGEVGPHPGRVVAGDGRVLPPPRPLFAWLGVTTVFICLVNIGTDSRALAVALSAPAAMLAADGLLRLNRIVPRAIGIVTLFEIVPAISLLYVYLAWASASGSTLEASSVLPVIGVVWTNWAFWKFGRKVGEVEVERIYALDTLSVCRVTLGVLGLSLATNVALYAVADLSVAYLVFAGAAHAVTAVSVIAYTRRFRRLRMEAGSPWWAGLAFPLALTAGVLVQLLAYAL